MNMKDKKITRKHLFAVIVIMVAALMIIPLCAFTANGNENSHDMETEDISIATPANAEAHDDEHQAEEDTPYISVSTYEELVAAIEQADAETVIGFGCTIECPDGADLGRPDYSIILRRTSSEGRFIFNGNESFVQNITFDGDDILSFYPIVSSGCSSLTMKNCVLINNNCSSDCAVSTVRGDLFLVDCLFDHNTGNHGAHLRMSGDNATIKNCTFTNGHARYRGGAIFSEVINGIDLSGCVITENTADINGGGIYNSTGTIRITQSKIHGNMSGSEMDDIALSPVSRTPEFDDYQEVIKLYEPDGLFPNDWETREFYEDMTPDPGTVYYRTFREKDPEQEPPSITLNHSELTLNIGDSDTLVATLQPEGTDGNIEWNSSDSSVATVDGAGLVTAVSAGETTITATLGDISATCLVTVLPNMYTIDVEPNPAHGGDVSGGGDYEDGASVTITASPKDGFLFLEWTENGSQVSTDASYTFTANSSRKLTAVFEAVPHPTFHIGLSATQGGTVSGEGNYEEGASVTVCATPDEGYRFLYWTENGEQISTEDSYSFTATSDRTLTAVFEAIPAPDPKPVCEIHVTATEGGSATGGGSFTEGDSVTVEATPDEGYRFLYWTEDNQPVCNEPSYSFPAENSRSLIAVFEPVLPPEQTGSPESGANGNGSGANNDKPGSNSGESGSNDDKPGSNNGDSGSSGESGANSNEFVANVKTDVPCSVTALIVFYDENGQMISAVSQDQFDLAASDSFILSTIAPPNWHTWKIIILAEGDSGSQPEHLNASYMVSPAQP